MPGRFPFHKAFYLKGLLHSKTVQSVQAIYPELKWVEVPDDAALQDYYPLFSGVDKKGIFVTLKKGPFLRRCPGTKEFICCNYLVCTPIHNCPYDCSYCFLKGYSNVPVIAVYDNWEAAFLELNQVFQESSGQILRVGTGEFTDSLALDPIFNQNRAFIEYFASQPKGVLEIKTKSTHIDHLSRIEHGGRTVIAWTLSPEKIIRREEKGTPTLKQRLKAAARVAQWGYPLAFHFDPLIYYAGWEKDYLEVVDNIFAAVPPAAITWISLGTMRYTKSTWALVKRQIQTKAIVTEEMLLLKDGKYRYFKGIRIAMYDTLVKALARHSPLTRVYLCMETPEVWNTVFHYVPSQTDPADILFYRPPDLSIDLPIGRD